VPFNQPKVDRCNLTKSQFHYFSRLDSSFFSAAAEHFDPSPHVTSVQFSLFLFFSSFLFTILFVQKKEEDRGSIDNDYVHDNGTECVCLFLFYSVPGRKTMYKEAIVLHSQEE
jgi:hypothetical protein